MYPEICTIGPVTIYSYGLMLVAAFIAASFLSAIQAKKEKINPDIIFNLTFISFLSGIIGSRVFYVVENFHYYIKNPLEIIMLQHGGMSWFGGLMLGAICGIAYLKSQRMPLYKILDLLAPFLALAQAIGRIGCLLNGCCYGKVSSHGIYFPVHDSVLIPTQLYSSLMLLAIFVFLRFMQDRPHKTGAVFFTYLLLYSIKRFFIEFWRADNGIVLFGLTLFQLLSIALFFISIVFLFRINKTKK